MRATTHIVVREADFEIARGLDLRASRQIALDLLGVVFPIDFDGQPCRHTSEVDDMATDRHLTTELPAVEAAIPELSPKEVFG